MRLASASISLHFRSKLISTHDGKDPNLERHVVLNIQIPDSGLLNTFALTTQL